MQDVGPESDVEAVEDMPTPIDSDVDDGSVQMINCSAASNVDSAASQSDNGTEASNPTEGAFTALNPSSHSFGRAVKSASKRAATARKTSTESATAAGDSGMRLGRELRQLTFRNPGPAFDFSAGSVEGQRRVRRQVQRTGGDYLRPSMYDSEGLLPGDLDLCDCMLGDCMGCHFPCVRCGSPKCGVECRSNRRWSYDTVEVEGTKLKWKNPCKELYEKQQ